jgi:CDGSH-type Zn-finger protein
VTSEELPPQRIEVTAEGPYRVRGRVPLRPAETVRDENGDAVDVATGEPLETGKTFLLCRCGHSGTKPFCDDTHLTEGFDGREVADRTPVVERSFVLEGEGVVVRDVMALCSRATFCDNVRTTVWDMVPETGDPEVREEMQAMIGRCPSGRLSFAPDATSPPTERELEPEVLVERDGPLWVRGGLPVVAADGETYEVRNRIALCRCGLSENKPFCDGSHKTNDFRG